MRAITVFQPWATLLTHGLKRCETRPARWAKTLTPGPLLIHAAKAWGPTQADIVTSGPFAEALRLCNLDAFSLPLGAIVGVVNVRCCISTENVQWEPSKDRFFGIDGYSATVVVGSWEKAFGDFSAGRIAVVTDQPRAFKKPIPYRGQHTLFDVPEPAYGGELAAASV